MFFLQLRMFFLLSVLFAVIYAMVVMIGASMGLGSFYVYFIFSFILMYVQYLVGPKIVEWSMRVQYVGQHQAPRLHAMVAEMAQKAGIPIPRLCVSPIGIPNAFAFGRGRGDGRVCVTESIMRLLNEEELSAVIGHEISHLKNRDVLTITLLSVIPMIMYRIAWHFLFFGGDRRNERGNAVLIGMVAFLFYFITNLLVLYASRIREYFADRGSIALGNRPEALATALYKLVYGSARVGKQAIKEAEGLKAFFVNDPSRALSEVRELGALDLDRNGTIDSDELAALRGKTVRLSTSDRLLEFLSTHPNMLERIKRLSENS